MLASDYGKIRQLVKNLFSSIFPFLLFTPFPVSPKGEKPFDVGFSFPCGGIPISIGREGGKSHKW
jgi:hypothetical protein